MYGDSQMSEDERFVPYAGLDLKPYLKVKDISAVHHLIRYIWALEVIADLNSLRNVLDIACGVGYGNYLIAKKFPNIFVTGVDYDPSAIKYAKQNYVLPNLEYKLGDPTRWEETIGSDKFDCIVSFDTIEHICHREIMMQNLIEHLHKSGSLLLSTPCGQSTTILQPESKYHKIVYSSASLYDFLRRYFMIVIRPDDGSLPHLEVFKLLEGSGVSYLLKMNPVLCKEPIIIPSVY